MLRGLGTPPAKRKKALWVAAGIFGAFVAFETSFWFRELIVAELFFGVVFFLLSALVASFYLVGVACARVFESTRRACTFLWVQHHQIFGTIRMIGRKTFVIVSMWFGALIFPMRLSPAQVDPVTAVRRDAFIYAKYVADGDQAFSRPHTDMGQSSHHRAEVHLFTNLPEEAESFHLAGRDFDNWRNAIEEESNEAQATYDEPAGHPKEIRR